MRFELNSYLAIHNVKDADHYLDSSHVFNMLLKSHKQQHPLEGAIGLLANISHSHSLCRYVV